MFRLLLKILEAISVFQERDASTFLIDFADHLNIKCFYPAKGVLLVNLILGLI